MCVCVTKPSALSHTLHSCDLTCVFSSLFLSLFISLFHFSSWTDELITWRDAVTALAGTQNKMCPRPQQTALKLHCSDIFKQQWQTCPHTHRPVRTHTTKDLVFVTKESSFPPSVAKAAFLCEDKRNISFVFLDGP